MEEKEVKEAKIEETNNNKKEKKKKVKAEGKSVVRFDWYTFLAIGIMVFGIVYTLLIIIASGK